MAKKKAITTYAGNVKVPKVETVITQNIDYGKQIFNNIYSLTPSTVQLGVTQVTLTQIIPRNFLIKAMQVQAGNSAGALVYALDVTAGGYYVFGISNIPVNVAQDIPYFIEARTDNDVVMTFRFTFGGLPANVTAQAVISGFYYPEKI